MRFGVWPLIMCVVLFWFRLVGGLNLVIGLVLLFGIIVVIRNRILVRLVWVRLVI